MIYDPRLREDALNAQSFNWNWDTLTASEEASTVRFFECSFIRSDDVHCIGIAVKNGKKAAWFVLKNTEYNTDGDPEQWEFEPLLESLKYHPKLKGWKLIIFND